MLDSERIKRRLLNISEYRKRVRQIIPATQSAYSKSEFVVKGAIERNLQLISDQEFDILVLLHKGLDLKLSGDEDSLLESLGGRLGQHAISKIKERRVLRNLLVHAYADSSYDESVYRQAKNQDDLEDFARAVNRILSNPRV